MTTETNSLPEMTPRDVSRRVVEGAIGSIPGGGALVELVRAIAEPGYDRRMHEWRMRLAAMVDGLPAEVVASLSHNDEFLDCLISATRIALGTHLEEKLDILVDVVASAAVRPERDIQAVSYLYLVDALEPEHIALLKESVELLDLRSASGSEFDNEKWLSEVRVRLGLTDEEISTIMGILGSRNLLRDGYHVAHKLAHIKPTPLGTEFIRWLTTLS